MSDKREPDRCPVQPYKTMMDKDDSSWKYPQESMDASFSMGEAYAP
jgi:hypothetical protein